MITKIAFVSYPTKTMAASRKFFGDVLGLKQTASHGDQWCEFDTPDAKITTSGSSRNDENACAIIPLPMITTPCLLREWISRTHQSGTAHDKTKSEPDAAKQLAQIRTFDPCIQLILEIWW